MYLASKANSQHLMKAVNDACNLAAIDDEKEDIDLEEDALARYHWALRTGEPRVYKVHYAVKKELSSGDSAAVIDKAVEYINGLVETSDLYLSIRRPDMRLGFLSSLLSHEVMEDVCTYFELLNDEALGTIDSFAPLLMGWSQGLRAQPTRSLRKNREAVLPAGLAGIPGM